MSSAGYVSLIIRQRLSRHLLFVFAGGYCFAIAAVFTANSPWLFKVLLLLGIFVSAAILIRRYLFLQNPDSIIEIRRLPDDWLLVRRGGDDNKARLLSASFWLGLIVLVFELEQSRKVTVLLAPDQVSTESWRELRSYIRHSLF